MNTKNLITLNKILETGSFQKAAKQLNYTQSTVTFQIHQLEQELSIKLFNKIGRKMELTQIGKEILPLVDTILQATEQLNYYGKNLAEMTGILKLVIPDSILIYLMQPLIRRFLNLAPKIQLIVNSISSEDIDDAIINGNADIGINCDKGSYPDTIIHKQMSPFRACLVASSSFDSTQLDFITPHQKKSICMISNEPNGNYQKSINDYLAFKDITLNPYMKMQSIEAVKKSVMNNLGIAYIPIFAIRNELENGSFIQINTELDENLYTSVVVFNKNKWQSPQMKVFLKILDERPDKVYQ